MRCSNTDFAVTPNLDAHYLTVSHAFVSKINVETCEDGSTKATGVQVIMPDGGELTVNIEDGGEVILSAGVFKTPQLLELSGIGDPDILEPLGIEVKHELKGVGRNYEEQWVSRNILYLFTLIDSYQPAHHSHL
jgi:choline dehydrogenase-like flavoprotein